MQTPQLFCPKVVGVKPIEAISSFVVAALSLCGPLVIDENRTHLKSKLKDVCAYDVFHA